MTFFLAARAFLGKIPWQAWAALAALAALWWAYHSGYQKRDALAKSEIAEMISIYTREQAEAERLALAAKAETELRYRNLAERIDDEHARNQTAASDATSRYIDANRVQSCPAGSDSSTTAASANGDSSSVSAPVPTNIVMGEADVRACASLYTYAAAANEWARGLGE